mmetsp:Transcript_138815/g.276823  ORF Transcript_138815/g.276823 Transcript_138815/m.276823 type:complete len:208 (-) Transcript_138815:840-1463(-)
MKTAKTKKATIKNRGIRKIQPHHCFTGLSPSSWMVPLVSLAAIKPPTAANVGDGWTRPLDGCGEVGCSSPASRPRARAPVEAPTTPPIIPLSLFDRPECLPPPKGGAETAGSPCSRKRSSDAFFVEEPSALLPASLPVPVVVLMVPSRLLPSAMLAVLPAALPGPSGLLLLEPPCAPSLASPLVLLVLLPPATPVLVSIALPRFATV